MIKQSWNYNNRAYTDSDASTKRSQYSSLNNMSNPNRYCASGEAEAPVCPPMWNCPLENAMLQMPPPAPTPDRKKPMYTEKALRRPIDPFPAEDPNLVKPGSASSGSASPGGTSTDGNDVNRFCRQCGPRIQGVIGYPNANPNAPWPEVNGIGQEKDPFIILEAFSSAVNPTLRVADTYSPEYEHYLNKDFWLAKVSTALAVGGQGSDTLVVKGDDNSSLPFVLASLPAQGTLYLHGETITYDGRSASGEIITFTGLGRSLPQNLRVVHAVEKPVVVLEQSLATGNSSAGITVTVNDSRQVAGANLKTNLSRGSGFEDESILLVKNSNLGGVPASGMTLIQIRTTHWPDEDVASCIVLDDESKMDVARQYCCVNDTLTPSDWVDGAGRCAALAQYGVSRPGEWPQYCPDGFEYTPKSDGLFCTKCALNTSTFDPTVNPANCPPDGVGCHKCCENPAVQCL
jgi:hypothetical protein